MVPVKTTVALGEITQDQTPTTNMVHHLPVVPGIFLLVITTGVRILAPDRAFRVPDTTAIFVLEDIELVMVNANGCTLLFQAWMMV